MQIFVPRFVIVFQKSLQRYVKEIVFSKFLDKKITFSAVFLHFLCKYAHIFERFANFQTKKMQKKIVHRRMQV